MRHLLLLGVLVIALIGLAGCAPAGTAPAPARDTAAGSPLPPALPLPPAG